MWQPLGILNSCNSLILKQIFSKTKTFFKKLENQFLIESTKIEIVIFSRKATLLKANVKINRTGTAKWTYHKGQSFVSNYFIFLLKFCFSARTSSKELICRINYPNVHIHTFRKHWSFIWVCSLPVIILKSEQTNWWCFVCCSSVA